MKKLKIVLVIMTLALFSASFSDSPSRQEITSDQKRSGVAVIMTGAAARIPQEAGLLEELYDRGLLNNVVFISGVSSGALNAVMLNGILTRKATWSYYRNLLFNIRNSDVYIQDDKKIPVNTEPARELFKKIAETRLGYKEIGDLPIMTEISFTHLKTLDLRKEVYRMCSRKINTETDTTLSIVDILMASTSYPVAFPPVRIRNVTTIPDVEYVDGGVGDDLVPFRALLEFEKFRGKGVEKVYILSRKADSLPTISEELKGLGINDRGVFDRLGVSLDAMLWKGFVNRLEAYAEEAPELVSRTWVWVPDFKKDFLLFNFDNLKEQYQLTTEWAKTHDPVPLSEFLLPHLLSKKKAAGK
jgi:hypothetical protein